MTTSSAKIEKIVINGTTFYFDHNYQYIADLAHDKFEVYVAIMNQLFGKNDEMVKIIIDKALEEGALNDVPTTYLIAMTLQNYGEFKRAKTILEQLYKLHPHDLLARCAYANHFLFDEHSQKEFLAGIKNIFNDIFDLDKLYTEQTLPFITFIHFMIISAKYLFFSGDKRLGKHLSYLTEVAPEHEETIMLFKLFNDVMSEANSKRHTH